MVFEQLAVQGIKFMSGVGVFAIVKSAVKAITPEDMSKFSQLGVDIASVTIAGAAAMAADNYVDKEIEMARTMAKAVKEKVNAASAKAKKEEPIKATVEVVKEEVEEAAEVVEEKVEEVFEEVKPKKTKKSMKN